MSYYDNARPWPPAGQNAWNDLEIDAQTVRSGASSTVPGQGPPPPGQGSELAFTHQIEEVDRAIDNLMKSGKMFGVPGRHARQHTNARPHSVAEFGDARSAHQSNLQSFYASQRHQSSRGSNDAEQAIQAKRRMAAQRERELRNYHQEQQFNRTVPDASFGNKPADRTLSPSGSNMSETDRRDLIARQRSALYGEGSFAETGGYVDETGTPRPGVPGALHGPSAPGVLRGPSPLAFEYGRPPPPGFEGATASSGTTTDEGGPVLSPQLPQGQQPPAQSRNSSSSSPQPLRSASSGTSPVGASPVNNKPGSGAGAGAGASAGAGAGANTTGSVAPIGTRPSVSGTPGLGGPNAKRSTTPMTAPFSPSTTTGTPPASAGPDGGAPLWGAPRPASVWGNSSKNVQASVWG